MTAPIFPKILALPEMHVQAWQVCDDVLTLTIRCLRRKATCPVCGAASTRVHGRYRRQIQDLPCHGRRVCLDVAVRRFRCGNPTCHQQTFAETLPMVARHQRRSRRVQSALGQVGLALGGAAGARLLGHFGMAVCGDTILRTLTRMSGGKEPSAASPPQEIGIDDWAFRRGHRYGTLIVDLARRCPVDLLPDRETATVANWLTRHPQVRVVARDRAGAYAEAIRQGAPQAMQVADRWHLLKNLSETLERLLGRYRQSLRDTADELAGPAAPAADSQAPQRQPGKQQQLAQQRRACRLARYEEVVRLRHDGMAIRAIARTVHLDRRTVRGWLRAGRFPEHAARSAGPGRLDPYRAWLAQRWQAGCRDGAVLFREIVAQGYCGAASTLRRLLTPWRQTTTIPNPSVSVPSPRSASAWLLGTAYRSNPGAEYRQRFVDRLCRAVPAIETARRLASDFAAMVGKRRSPDLGAWVRQVGAAGIRELRQFADGLERDGDAVRAALTTDYSNGLAEGHINRLKMLKRQMYGRAGLPLLRIRVLHGARASITVT